MTEINREQIILSAYNATGPLQEGETPEGREARLTANITDLYFALDERSAVAKHLANLEDSTPFVAIIVSGGVEKSTGRGLINLLTKEGDAFTKEETIRTDFLNTPSGRNNLDLAKVMKGHKVLIYKQMEVGADKNKKYRVVRHIVDLGAVSED